MARELLRADVAITTMEPSPVLDERAVSLGLITRTVPPHQLRLYEFAGGDLERFLTSLLRKSPITPIGFDGGHLSFLGGSLRKIEINGQPMDRSKQYRIALDEKFYLQPSLVSIMREGIPTGPRGLTLWDAWSNFSQKNDFSVYKYSITSRIAM